MPFMALETYYIYLTRLYSMFPKTTETQITFLHEFLLLFEIKVSKFITIMNFMSLFGTKDAKLFICRLELIGGWLSW